jgi:hypothetical protein
VSGFCFAKVSKILYVHVVEAIIYFDDAESYPEGNMLWVDLILLDRSKLKGQIKYVPSKLGHKLTAPP